MYVTKITRLSSSLVTVIDTDIATAVDGFHRITTATAAVAIDFFDSRCSVAASNMVNSKRL